MESWSSISEGKDLVSDEISHTDSLTRNRNALLSWDLKSPCTFEAQNFWESGLPGILGKHVPSSFRSTISTTSLVSPSLFLGEDESSSKLPGSIVASNSRNSSLIDLKLGRLADNRDVYNSDFSKGASIFSYSKSSAPSKRMRASSGVYSVTAYCQVYGCNKDLSSSKEYHRRHKVCEVHSKTPKVIVKGIEQRFCQQCCRFQLLAEFDDGKRSCRKRLAGHNERRRKTQVALHSGRSGRFLQSYNGSCFPGTTLTAASFICQDILPSGILDLEYNGISDWCRRIKVEGSRQFKPLAGVPVTNAHLHLKPILSSYDVGKQYPTVYRNGINNVPTGSVLSDNGNHFLHDMRSSNSVSHSLYHESTLGSEVFNNVFITTASTVQGLSRIPDSGSAHSLLPSESQSSLSHSSEIPPARSLEMPVTHTHYSLSQVSDRLYGGSSQASASPMVISSGGGSETTIDLLQLSSQLQRVQDQQKSLQMKHENDAFCCLRIT